MPIIYNCGELLEGNIFTLHHSTIYTDVYLNKAKNTSNTKQLPNYITEFFNNIKFKIENCKDKQQQKMVLKDYDNKQKFMEYLDQRIDDSINRYFGFRNCDENVSDDDDTGFISD